jgi:hypothetical protein
MDNKLPPSNQNRKLSLDINSLPTTAKGQGQRICYLFVGKPGSGKSVLAEKLAKTMPAVVITPENIAQELIKEPTNAHYQQVKIDFIFFTKVYFF